MSHANGMIENLVGQEEDKKGRRKRWKANKKRRRTRRIWGRGVGKRIRIRIKLRRENKIKSKAGRMNKEVEKVNHFHVNINQQRETKM